jgi:hypothetical protein
MRLVLLGGVVMAGATPLAANVIPRIGGSVGYGATIDVTIEAIDPVVHGVGHLVGEGGAVIACLVAVGAYRAVDDFVLLVLSRGNTDTDPQTQREHDGGDGERTPKRGGVLGA